MSTFFDFLLNPDAGGYYSDSERTAMEYDNGLGWPSTEYLVVKSDLQFQILNARWGVVLNWKGGSGLGVYP